MTLSATCDSPREAYLYINSALRNYEAVAGDVFSTPPCRSCRIPRCRRAPSNTSWAMTYRWILTLAAMAAMAGVIFLFYLLRFTVKTPAAGERQLDGKVRGIVPFERKERGAAGKSSRCSLTPRW